MSTAIPTHVVAVFGVVKKGTQYLIAQRSLTDDQEPGAWFFPGGKVEKTYGLDVIEEGLKREIREEVGIEVSDAMTFISSKGFTRSSGDHVVGLVFQCSWRSGEARPLEDQAAICWKTKDELLMMTLPSYTLEVVKRLT